MPEEKKTAPAVEYEGESLNAYDVLSRTLEFESDPGDLPLVALEAIAKAAGFSSLAEARVNDPLEQVKEPKRIDKARVEELIKRAEAGLRNCGFASARQFYTDVLAILRDHKAPAAP